MTLEVRPASSRYVTTAEGRTTWHNFSFGAHYDPHNVTFGALVAHNDELLPPQTGYSDHPHVDVEIVTVVLSGALRHTDSAGHTGVLAAGQVQRLSAGSGVTHSEVNEVGEDTRFIQAWVRPDEAGTPPSYADSTVDFTSSGLLTVAGEGGAVPLGSRGASLHLGVAQPGDRLALPANERLHVFVIDGGVTLGDRLLGAGDSARMTHEGGRLLSADSVARVLVWALD